MRVCIHLYMHHCRPCRCCLLDEEGDTDDNNDDVIVGVVITIVILIIIWIRSSRCLSPSVAVCHCLLSLPSSAPMVCRRLLLSAVFGRCQWLLVVKGRRPLSSAVVGCCWSLFDVICHTVGCCCQLSSAVCCCCPSLSVVSRR